jgi:tetratricopeptide (TPR) repeat protein
MEQKKPIKIKSRGVICWIMKLVLLVLALSTVIGHAFADNKVNLKRAIIKVLGIIVRMFLIMDIGGAAQSSSDDLIKQGIELMNSHNPDNYTKAVKVLEQAIDNNQQDFYVWWLKGNALRRLYKYDEALVAFTNATKIDPQYPNAWDNEGKTLAKLDRLDEARNAYRSADALAGLWSPLEEDKTPAISPISSYTPWYQNLVDSVYKSVIVLVCSNFIIKGVTVFITTVGGILLAERLWGKGM